MKQEIEGLKQENRQIAQELDHSRSSQPPASDAASRQFDKELAKKLKKRELECQALWDTLKDMKVQTAQKGNPVWDVRKMTELLEVRALDTKAKRKLQI